MSIDTQTEPQTSTLSSKGMLIGGQWVESASGARGDCCRKRFDIFRINAHRGYAALKMDFPRSPTDCDGDRFAYGRNMVHKVTDPTFRAGCRGAVSRTSRSSRLFL